MDDQLHIAHVVHRFDFGGMENGLANLVNRLSPIETRHSIICLTQATEFTTRIHREDTEIIELNKPEGKHLPTYWRLQRVLKQIGADIVHTRNLGTLDMGLVARMAGCRVHVHGEHGWTADDPHGVSRKYRLLRKICDPAVNAYVAVTRDIGRWLADVIGIPVEKIHCIANGIDTTKYGPAIPATAGARANNSGYVVFGTLGRQDPIKGLPVFIEAVRQMIEKQPGLRQRVRIVMAGDGSEHRRCRELRRRYNLEDVIEFPGMVENVSKLLRDFDFFVQPSLNEGMSNTVMEAMASGLPIVATAVGGNAELIRDGLDGYLVDADDVSELQNSIESMIGDESTRRQMGASARQRVCKHYSIDAMIAAYSSMYNRLAAASRPAAS